MISDTINGEIVKALKSKNQIKLDTLKLLSAALHNKKIEKRGKLTKEEEIEVVRKEVKKRKDAIEAYEKAGAKDRVEKEKKEIKILQKYLPEKLSDKDLEGKIDSAITAVGAENMADFGRVMGEIMQEVKGQADGNKVAELVKKKLKG